LNSLIDHDRSRSSQVPCQLDAETIHTTQECISRIKDRCYGVQIYANLATFRQHSCIRCRTPGHRSQSPERCGLARVQFSIISDWPPDRPFLASEGLCSVAEKMETGNRLRDVSLCLIRRRVGWSTCLISMSVCRYKTLVAGARQRVDDGDRSGLKRRFYR
jgi:hypothetical protein